MILWTRHSHNHPRPLCNAQGGGRALHGDPHEEPRHDAAWHVPAPGLSVLRSDGENDFDPLSLGKKKKRKKEII